ncbi:MAG: hypothetical protein J6K73_12855 [Clostridia bacterium]|nr:hypothetical protein [Clostridia bacterium]MBP3650659.1 hypothetical protein [Clostridia bacterium]
MTDNIIHIDFSKPDDRWLKKAHVSRINGDVEKAVQLYRTAVEQNPDDFEAGLCYARYLWEIDCWRSSLRECYRLLCQFPEEEKVYGLVYRNLLALGLEDDARFAYEHYMAYLYQNPEGGLNLNEENPPMPEKPPKRRFKHLLLRATRLLERGDYDRANHLLVHANHPSFPRQSVLRDLLEVQLMAKTGLEEEAMEIVHGMVDGCELNASQALALLPLMSQLEGPEYAGKLLLYASSVAHDPNELRDVTGACLGLGQSGLAVSILRNLAEENEYRIDLLYQLAVAYLHNGEVKPAWQLIQKCYQLDPCDAAVNYFYRLMTDGVHSGATAEEILKMPLTLYGSANNVGRMVAKMHIHELVTQNSPEEAANLLLTYAEQSRVLDGLCLVDDEEFRILVNEVAYCLPPDTRNTLLRLFLLFGDLSEDVATLTLEHLAAIREKRQVTMVRNGRLTAETVEDYLHFID